MKTLTPAERLIVAADFRLPTTVFPGIEWVRRKVVTLAKALHGTGVCIKVNSALRACGYSLIHDIHGYGLRAFADLKLYDIGETLATDGEYLLEVKPELLTVACSTGELAMRALKNMLPDTEVLGVTVLTTFDRNDAIVAHGGTVRKSVIKLANSANHAGIDGLVCAATEAEMLHLEFKDRFTLNTPAIRPTWAIIPGDDQNPDQIMTPSKAIKAGADRIVVGRPIIRAANPYDAAMRIIDEIAEAIVSVEKREMK